MQYAPDFPRLAINSGVSDGGDNVVPEFRAGFMLTAPVTNGAEGGDEENAGASEINGETISRFCKRRKTKKNV